MSDQGKDAREEAREYLRSFLDQLHACDQTNRAMLQIQIQIANQLRADYQQRVVLSAQLNGVAQRLDLVDHGLAALVAVLEGSELPDVPQVEARARYPSVGQTIGGVVGLGVDRMMRGGGGRRRR